MKVHKKIRITRPCMLFSWPFGLAQQITLKNPNEEMNDIMKIVKNILKNLDC